MMQTSARRRRDEAGSKRYVLAEIKKLRLFLHPGASWRNVLAEIKAGAGRDQLLRAGLCIEGPK